ncbi:MAG: enoyl-CoA hydratase, partial [Betaproteobacteria bacterium]|nr:enoyl-CoA hydratase [Betaproteobacteria bacterium]
MQTLTDKLVAEKENGVGWITFNNPARHNAMSFEMWQGMAEVLNAYAVDPEVRVVILKGAGEKAFVAGADISQFKERRTGPEAVAEYNAMADSAN